MPPAHLVPLDDDTSIYADFTPDVLAAFPLTELSDASRSKVDTTVRDWSAEVRENIAAARQLPFEQLPDSVPEILIALADALGSTDSTVRRQLLVRSPSQGITRFQQHYDTRDLMAEDRLLRRQVSTHVVEHLGRPMTPGEDMALHMGLDLMSQQAVNAFVTYQNEQLRSAAEAELRYLSFLSHDLNNNLSGVTVWLQVLKLQLKAQPEMHEQVTSLDRIQESILTTVGGMGRLLEAERLRHGGKPSVPKLVNLRTLVTNQTRQVAQEIARRGCKLIVDVPTDATLTSDPELITLVLQNLIGNVGKFASPGIVKVRATQIDAGAGQRQWAVSVADAGPGIPPEQRDRIFLAFQRGTMQGEAGVGLGLAIASRAASLLGGKLTVDSTLGVGSTFTFTLPAF